MLLLDPAVQTMVNAVERYGGTVNRVQGDGIMALFGAPVATEDHATRACLAAQAILADVAGLHGKIDVPALCLEMPDRALGACRRFGKRLRQECDCRPGLVKIVPLDGHDGPVQDSLRLVVRKEGRSFRVVLRDGKQVHFPGEGGGKVP